MRSPVSVRWACCCSDCCGLATGCRPAGWCAGWSDSPRRPHPAGLAGYLAAFGKHVAIGVCVPAYALVMVVSLLPVTPGGLGVLEASQAALLVSPGTSR